MLTEGIHLTHQDVERPEAFEATHVRSNARLIARVTFSLAFIAACEILLVILVLTAGSSAALGALITGCFTICGYVMVLALSLIHI